jgi:5-methylcytosine-specific restriction endonuclease McrA
VGARTGHAYRQLRARVIAEESHCCRCHRPVDKTLEHPHPYSPSLDHLDPLSEGGALLDRNRCALAHLRCNVSHGATLGNRQRRPGRPRRNSIEW